MKKSIGTILKELRIKAGLKPKEVYEKLGVKQSRFSAWERDVAEPPTEILLQMCDLYGVTDILKAFGYNGYNEDGSLRLDIREETLIENYRKLSPFNRETVQILVERMLKGCQTTIRTIERPVYLMPVSAGTGQFLDSDEYDMVDFPEEDVPSDSTFGVRVSGDSMEPEYKDGSIVFVKQVKNLNPGDIGIFTLNDEGFLKELGENRTLVSLNPKYKDIKIGEYDDLRIVGKVVGKYPPE